ncbi:MAG: PleD family two-component system response regulator [Kiloniellaceae bacterium]
MGARPIILAEDNDKLRRVYADMLEAVGYSVMRASDGAQAIALLHKIVNPHLIILDVMMPNMNGIEACTRIRNMQGPKPCPILFLTALDQPENILECLRAGGDDYLMKSAPLAEILERVRYWSRKGSVDDGTGRRDKAIKALEALAADSREANCLNVAAEVSADQLAVDQLAAFLARNAAAFGDETAALYRFGYMVGLVEACAPAAGKTAADFTRFMRNLVLRSNFVDRNEADALLDNYRHIADESQFRDGWERGRGDAADVGMPQIARLNDRFNDRSVAR